MAGTNDRLARISLTEADYVGLDERLVFCRQCSGEFCSSKAARLLNGAPVIVCGRTTEGQAALLAQAKRLGKSAK